MAQIRLGFTGEMVTPMIPISPLGIPLFSINDFQVAPPSLDFHKLDPSPPEEKS